MDVNFAYTDAAPVLPVVFEQVWGEKPGGGLVTNPTYDIKPSTAVGLDSGALKPIKAYRLVKAVAAEDTTIEIAKGSGVAVGDKIAHGTLAVACTAVDKTTHATKDVVTVTLGVIIANKTVLYQAAAASVAAVAEVKAGYYDAISTTEGALLVVAADAGAGEVLLATVQASYQGIKIIAADDYVTLVAEGVAGVAGVPAAPIYTPLYLTGANVIVYAGKGDQAVKLVNGANVRKETVEASLEVLALMSNINPV
jgi:hypothetical protein